MRLSAAEEGESKASRRRVLSRLQFVETTSTTTGSSARVGDTRVSTVSQTLDQRQAALNAAGVVKTFSHSIPGALLVHVNRQLGLDE